MKSQALRTLLVRLPPLGEKRKGPGRHDLQNSRRQERTTPRQGRAPKGQQDRKTAVRTPMGMT